jgi:hypothetical protein
LHILKVPWLDQCALCIHYIIFHVLHPNAALPLIRTSPAFCAMLYRLLRHIAQLFYLLTYMRETAFTTSPRWSYRQACHILTRIHWLRTQHIQELLCFCLDLLGCMQLKERPSQCQLSCCHNMTHKSNTITWNAKAH